MQGSGYFLKIAKINSQQEKPICPNRKNYFPQNTKNHQSENKLPQKFCATWYDLPYAGWVLLITIELFKDSWTARSYTRFKYSEAFIKLTPSGPYQVSPYGCLLNRDWKNCAMFVNDQHSMDTLYCDNVACR